mgnify:CR=1 FL=1
MTNLEKLNNIFCEVFSVEAEVLNEQFDNQRVDNWDSIHQLTLTSAVEDTFDIMLDPEDIIMFTSYENVKEVLKKYEVL